MGSFIEINDTLQLTKDQGFPQELDIEKHMQDPYKLEDFKNRIFEFHDKPDIRIYKVPPVRNFFVENRDGKWIYWGLVHITAINHDYKNRTTSGEFNIVYIYSPAEMKLAHKLIDRDPDTEFIFKN